MHDLDDRGYKWLFSNKEIFRQLVTSFVKEEWVKDLDFSNCELVPGAFVSENYEKTFSDLMYKVKWRDRDFGRIAAQDWEYRRHVVFGGNAL